MEVGWLFILNVASINQIVFPEAFLRDRIMTLHQDSTCNGYAYVKSCFVKSCRGCPLALDMHLDLILSSLVPRLLPYRKKGRSLGTRLILSSSNKPW